MKPISWKKVLKLALIGVLLFYLISFAVVPLFRENRPPVVQAAPSVLSPVSPERVLCIDDNREAVVRRLQVIASAQDKLILSTYSLRNDEAGQLMMAAVLNAADRGVQVELLVDGLCVFTGLGRSPAFQALAASDNLSVRLYNPVNLLLPWRINYRMHDKYIIADNSLYLLGGRNLNDASLAPSGNVDRDVLVYTSTPEPGHSLFQVKRYFESVWNLSKPYAGRPRPEKQAELRSAFQALSEAYPEALTLPNWESETFPVTSIQLIHNPIEAKNKYPLLFESLCRLMEGRGQVTIHTPYVVCSRAMYDGLSAIVSGGTRIDLITNSPDTGANPSGCADYLNQRKRISSTGVRLYEYAGTQSAHTKTLLLDDRLSVVGTFNLDMRSCYLDTEMMLVIDSPELNAQIRASDNQHRAESLCRLPNGQVTAGAAYQEPPKDFMRTLLHGVLRVVTLPFRALL